MSFVAVSRNLPQTNYRLRGRPVVRSRCQWLKRRETSDATTFLARCFPRTIRIPVHLRDTPLQVLFASCKISTRLAQTLRNSSVRLLGDLHARRVGDFAWERNCGLKTLQELDSLASAFARAPADSSAFVKRPSSCNHRTAVSLEVETRQEPASFAIPDSICGLRFDELPITKRLANVVRANGLRSLGDLNERTHFGFLRYRGCGWRTLVEIQQLTERAISGEFNVVRIEESKAVPELLTLLEQAIAKLAPRDRRFLIARIGGMTFAEIGYRYGFTRARVHQAVVKALDTLRKTWGPRIPRLLETLNARCLSIPNRLGLTPALLEQWIGDASKSFRLSREAQFRLIAALNKRAPAVRLSSNQRKSGERLRLPRELGSRSSRSTGS